MPLGFQDAPESGESLRAPGQPGEPKVGPLEPLSSEAGLNIPWRGVRIGHCWFLENSTDPFGVHFSLLLGPDLMRVF